MVSVIIIATDDAASLPEAIKSVQAQTYKDWKALIIDNGSTDSTREIANEVAQSDPRFTVYTTPHSTQGAARAFGINKADTEWVTILNANDTLEPGAIEWFISRIPPDDTPLSIIAGGLNRITSSGTFPVRGNFSGLLSTDSYIASLLRGDFAHTFGGKLIRRKHYIYSHRLLDSEIENQHELIALILMLPQSSNIYINTGHYCYNYNETTRIGSHALNFRGWVKTINAIKPNVPDDETFYTFALRLLYNSCILEGATFASSHPAIKFLKRDAKRFNLLDSDRRILRLLKYSWLRKREAKRHNVLFRPLDTLISIILVAQNNPNEVEATIRSLLNQTFGDWELIVVDNFSSDLTPELVRGFAATDPRVRLVTSSTHTNRGEARILGSKLARGSYIGFLQAGREFAPQALEKMWKVAASTDADIIVMGTKAHAKHGWSLINIFSPEKYFNSAVVESHKLVADMLAGDGLPYIQCDRIYRRSSLKLSKHTFEEIGDDAIFNLRTLADSNTVAWTNYPGLHIHAEHLFHPSYERLLKHDILVIERIEQMFDEPTFHVSDPYWRNCALTGLAHNFLFYVTELDRKANPSETAEYISNALQHPMIIKALGATKIKPEVKEVLSAARMHVRRYSSRYKAIRRIFNN